MLLKGSKVTRIWACCFNVGCRTQDKGKRFLGVLDFGINKFGFGFGQVNLHNDQFLYGR